MIDKKLLKNRFEKSLETYDNNAIIQNYMAAKLMELLQNSSGENFKKIFEFGIGSANLTRSVSENLVYKELFLNDIIKKSSTWARKYTDDFVFIEGDVEKISLPLNMDLITANAVVQWIKDFDKFIENITESMDSGGIFAFSTFGEDNFLEIKKVFDISLKYLPIEVLETKLKKHFNVLHISEDRIEMDFPNPKEVLKHIKKTGVNSIGLNTFYKASLAKFNTEYKKHFSSQDGVKLTYHPIFVVAQKISKKSN